MSTTEYRWRPLDKARHEIRVLDLEPGTGDATLSGQLRYVFLDESEQPDYEAISYAWGETDLVDNISVIDQNVPIPARCRVCSALHEVAGPDSYSLD